MRRHRTPCWPAIVSVLALALLAPAARADDVATRPKEAPAAAQQPPAKKGGGVMGFPNLIQGLREIDGCIKAVAAKGADGKHLIFGWFEDKEAVTRWYRSAMHQGMLDRFFPMRIKDREPLHWVDDGFGPILAIASVTLPEKPGQPIPQLAIEIYTPIHGGFAMGELFGPKEFRNTYMHYDQFDNFSDEDEEQADGTAATADGRRPDAPGSD